MEKVLIKSPLNYVGGKFKLLTQILPLFPNGINKFYDIFGGGFNVGINCRAEKVVYNDVNIEVVKLLDYISRTDTDNMLEQIDRYIEKYELSKTNEAGYRSMRDDYNKSDSISPIMLYILICYSFNNQIRFNSKGKFNMPFGRDRSSFNPALREKFIHFSDTLKDKKVDFRCFDFREILRGEQFEDNDFVYCDPPYFNSTATYNENNGWSAADEKDLLAHLERLNIKWALSNNLKTNPMLKDWAERNGYIIHYLSGTYGNCNYHKKDKSRDIEILITNYKESETL